MYDELVKLIKESNNIVFFGGAGVSTESHIPDFRSEDGLYKAKTKYGYSPETLISHSFFQRHTDKFYEYYKENLIYLDAKPNDAHYALAKLEEMGKLKVVVTQNICTKWPVAKMYMNFTEVCSETTVQNVISSMM